MINDLEDINNTQKLINENKLKSYVFDFIKANPGKENIEKTLNKLRSIYKITPSKAQMRYIYEKYFSHIPLASTLSIFMIKKASRSRSGVLVSTIVLKPDVFSCPKKCAYCPTETDLDGNPTQPKSYLSSEPAMLRALQYNFDVRGQLWDRIRAYIQTGNIQKNSGSNKMEIILSGGTWESYPYEYRKQVMNELYWGANTFNNNREMLSIEEEIKINETSEYRIIGLTIETRPDFITNQSIRDYRKWGVTRVQIGVQHYDDSILEKIKRECTTKDTMNAIRKLKNCGFKVVCHLMPDLPGSSPELDKWMFDQAIHNPDLQFDDVKIYPTAVCQSSSENLVVKSDIADWYKSGEYIPYGEKNLRDLIEVLKYYKTNIQPWVRIQRLVRDIPKQSIEAGYEKISNLRQIIHDELKKQGKKCRCIRCMEIGDNEESKKPNLVVRKYKASGGDEYHISFECCNVNNWFRLKSFVYKLFGKKIYYPGDLESYQSLFGFCRLRLDKNAGEGIIKEIKDSALIREVHVYGHSLGVNESSAEGSREFATEGSSQEFAAEGSSQEFANKVCSQHKGYGQMLVKIAEEIAEQNGYKKIAVIAGVGTREYYKNKCGYTLEGTFMTKTFTKKLKNSFLHIILAVLVIIISVLIK